MPVVLTATNTIPSHAGSRRQKASYCAVKASMPRYRGRALRWRPGFRDDVRKRPLRWIAAAWQLTSVRVGRRTRRHIAQERVAAVALDRVQVVGDQPGRPFDCDLDAILRKVEHRD